MTRKDLRIIIALTALMSAAAVYAVYRIKKAERGENNKTEAAEQSAAPQCAAVGFSPPVRGNRMPPLSIRISLSVLLISIIAFGSFQLWKTQYNYSSEYKTHERLLVYKPVTHQTGADEVGFFTEPVTGDLVEETVFNENIAELRKLNSDVAGWITIDGTNIDYPFVIGSDNNFYLRHDIDKKNAYAGTVFMDYRCNPGFYDFNTILYGHHMKNGSMFHDLINFKDADFFNANKTGMIYLENKNIPIEIFACAVVNPIDLGVFTSADNYLTYLRAHERQWREVKLSAGVRIITLSTCSYEFDNARTIVVARVVE